MHLHRLKAEDLPEAAVPAGVALGVREAILRHALQAVAALLAEAVQPVDLVVEDGPAAVLPAGVCLAVVVLVGEGDSKRV